MSCARWLMLGTRREKGRVGGEGREGGGKMGQGFIHDVDAWGKVNAALVVGTADHATC